MRKTGASLIAASVLAGAFWTAEPVRAQTPYDALGAAAAAAAAAAGAPAGPYPYFYDGRRYCWYDGGWHGPGWYWCGYAWRRGFGWGGPHGWRGWARTSRTN